MALQPRRAYHSLGQPTISCGSQAKYSGTDICAREARPQHTFMPMALKFGDVGSSASHDKRRDKPYYLRSDVEAEAETWGLNFK